MSSRLSKLTVYGLLGSMSAVVLLAAIVFGSSRSCDMAVQSFIAGEPEYTYDEWDVTLPAK